MLTFNNDPEEEFSFLFVIYAAYRQSILKKLQTSDLFNPLTNGVMEKINRN